MKSMNFYNNKLQICNNQIIIQNNFYWKFNKIVIAIPLNNYLEMKFKLGKIDSINYKIKTKIYQTQMQSLINIF